MLAHGQTNRTLIKKCACAGYISRTHMKTRYKIPVNLILRHPSKKHLIHRINLPAFDFNIFIGRTEVVNSTCGIGRHTADLGGSGRLLCTLYCVRAQICEAHAKKGRKYSMENMPVVRKNSLASRSALSGATTPVADVQIA